MVIVLKSEILTPSATASAYARVWGPACRFSSEFPGMRRSISKIRKNVCLVLTMWAIGKTSLEKCDLGSKLSFLGLRYIVLWYILIASSASPGKLHAESLFTPPLQRLQHLWLPCAFFSSASTVWCGTIPANATANRSCAILFPAQKQALKLVCWKKPGWALTATCSMPFINSPASA